MKHFQTPGCLAVPQSIFGSRPFQLFRTLRGNYPMKLQCLSSHRIAPVAQNRTASHRTAPNRTAAGTAAGTASFLAYPTLLLPAAAFAAVSFLPCTPTREFFAHVVFLTPATDAPLCLRLSLVASRCWSRIPAPPCQCALPGLQKVLPQCWHGESE